MSRRDFPRKTATVAGVAAGVAATEGLLKPVLAADGGGRGTATADAPTAGIRDTRRGEMIYRPLGRTGEQVSIIGVGGAHLGAPDEKEAVRIIRTAVDHGVTFMDNSWDYNNGDSETRMGKALRDGYRDKVFLMTKFDGRTKESAARQIDESLRRLQTDRVDLMQVHEVIRMEDPDRVFSTGGAIEALLAAQKAGKTRFIGFTGHKDPVVHLRMIETATDHGVRFDTVQMPLNVMDAHYRSFQQQVLPVLVREEIGVLGMKPMGSPHILKSRLVTPAECLHYSMSLPVSTVITGIDSMAVLEQDLEIVRTFKPLTREQMNALLARTAQAAGRGQYELFKTTDTFDSTAHHPEWLG